MDSMKIKQQVFAMVSLDTTCRLFIDVNIDVMFRYFFLN